MIMFGDQVRFHRFSHHTSIVLQNDVISLSPIYMRSLYIQAPQMKKKS